MDSVKFWKSTSGILAVIIGVLLFILWQQPDTKAPVIAIPITASATNTIPSKVIPVLFQSITVQHGDSLASLFLQYKLNFADLQKIMKMDLAKKYLLNIKPNDQIFYRLDENNALVSLKFPIDIRSTLIVTNKNNKFSEQLIQKPINTATIFRSGVVRGNFSTAAKNAGLTPNLSKELVSIFRGEINFSKDIRHGDQFRVLYQEQYVEGQKYQPGDIVAAEVLSHGKTYQIFRYTYAKNHSGYYDLHGDAIKPMFVFPPVNYSRISDRFSYHRYDPVMHVMRPHLGVDYAAPENTPIKSIGNGEVIFSGKENGYGNTVIVQYNGKYKALYGHMHRFAHGIRHGVAVKQGQVIGFVGHSGWATGAHLHFEFYVHGVPKNALAMHFGAEKSLPKKYLRDFHQKATQFLAQLNSKKTNA